MKRMIYGLLFALFLSIGAAIAPLPNVAIAGVHLTGTETTCAGYWAKVSSYCALINTPVCPFPYGMLYTKWRWYGGNAMTGYYPTNTYKTDATGCFCQMA
jgi:hypothetical protein